MTTTVDDTTAVREEPAGKTNRLAATVALVTPWRAFLAGATVLAWLSFHIGSDTAYDLFIDEPFYAQVGQSVARGGMPYAAGVHFFLHPPGYFLIEAGWMQLFGLHNEVFAQVYSLRKLIAIFAALSVLMIALIVERVAGRSAAVVTASLFGVNAFVHRQSGINILEPSTVFWALAGYMVLVRMPVEPGRRRRIRIVTAGLLFGFSIMSKEFAVFITMVPMAFAWLFRCWVSRREALALVGLSAVPYLLWVGVVAATGNWGTYVFQVSTGFKRTAGTTQITGFNKADGPSFADALIRNVYYLWTAYLILGLGSIAILYLAWKATTPLQRFIACYGLGAIPLLTYCVLIGTNEEQFFNFLLTPALIALVVVARNLRPRLPRALVVAGVLLASSMVVSDVANWISYRSDSDDGTYQVDNWMARNVPPGTVVAVTNSVQREIFTRYTMVNFMGASTVRNKDVRYLVVFRRQVDDGYAFVGPKAVDREVARLTTVFETSSRSNGRMTVYEVP